MTARYYLDHNATTPLDPRVAEVMRPYTEKYFGNPSSIHAEGRKMRAAVDVARGKVAAWLGAKPHEIIFTGGGTESNNLAVLGLARAQAARGKHLLTTQAEHHAVLQAFQALEKYEGFQVTYLPVERDGTLDVARLKKSIRTDTILVSVMSANNETGVQSPLREIGQCCAERGVFFHVDAVQSAGKEKMDVTGWQASAVSVAAHKFYGPPGVGVLYLKAGHSLRKITYGGAHENERRPGTENVAAIVGLAHAAELIEIDREAEAVRQFDLIELLWGQLADLPGIQRNGHPAQRIANTLNVSLAGLKGEELLMALDLAGLAVSSGSACLVGSVQASHVLQAMGVSPEVAQATVRFSIGKMTRAEDIPEIAQRVRAVVEHQRQLLLTT